MSGRGRTGAARRESQIVHQVASWCLSYPDEEFLAWIPALGAAVDGLSAGTARAGLRAFLDDARVTPLGAAQRRYVDLFDLSSKHALYLTYWTDGDTRRRGEVLGRIKARYRASGFLVDTRGELTDFLPLVLEYAAVADPVDGPALLQEYRASLELLRFALIEARAPHAAVVGAVCSTLPGVSPADRAAVHRMAADGPPREEVGLDAYDPRLLPLMGAGTTGGTR